MSKYRNVKRTLILREDGKAVSETFDSGAEAERYLVLNAMLKDGEITELVHHGVVILLQPSFRFNGKTVRAITYEPDFVYVQDGQRVIEDVKGGRRRATSTEAFRIKWKLLQYMIATNQTLLGRDGKALWTDGLPIILRIQEE